MIVPERTRRWLALCVLGCVCCCSQQAAGQTSDPLPTAPAAIKQINYSREVLPILAENCYACHGPDVANRESDYRLDSREALFTAVDSTSLHDSEFLRRLRSTDADEQMPPPKSHKKPLKPEQIAILEKWLEQGAPGAGTGRSKSQRK